MNKLIASLALAGFGLLNAQADEVAFVNGVQTGNQPVNGPFNLGLDFTVNSGYSISVDQIGAFNSGASGDFGNATIIVALYNAATGLQIAGTQTSFNTANPGTAIGGSMFQSISPVVLGAGQYLVDAVGYATAGGTRNGNASVSPITTAFDSGSAAVSFSGGWAYDGKGTLDFPTGNQPSNLSQPAIAAGTFAFTSLPDAGSTLTMLTGAVGALLAVRRRKL